MAIIKCKMCGGDLALIEGKSVAECEYCGTLQTVPAADNEKKLTLFSRANRLRAACDFDKAAGIYEAIVAEFPEEAEAYWGLVLCKYGIEYVDDPATGKKIPTCHRSSFESILEDSDFEQAMENADEIALRVYREEAKQIERIRKGILAVSSSEKPYDIFICYKETDSKGDRTVDSLLAQSIYDALTEKGYRVFFSRISLEDKLGQAYEPYIFAALNSAKIMLAVGTCYENYNAVWVKNEWSRYLKIIAQDKNKYLIPCYKNIDAYDIPKEFAHLQGQDMGKVGAMADLLRGIEKLLPRQKGSTTVVQERVVIGSGEHTAPLLRRVKLFLEDRDWYSADKYCEKVLDMEPENGEAYFCKLMAEYKVSTEEELGRQNAEFLNSASYQKARRFGNDSIQEKLENARKDTVYYAATRLAAQNGRGNQSKSAYQEAIAQLGTIPGWRDAGKLILNYRAQIAQIEAREKAAREEQERQAQLAREQAEEDRKQAQKKAKQTKKLAKIAVPIIGAAVAVVIALNSLVMPMLQGSNDPETTQLEQETPATEAAVPIQTEPPTEVILDPQAQAYLEAENLLSAGETAKAAIAFGKLGDYADARERSFALWEGDTVSAGTNHVVAIKKDGSVVAVGNSFGQDYCQVQDWKDIVSVAASDFFTAGLKSDGTVVVTSSEMLDFREAVSQWEDIVQISAAGRSVVGLKADGRIVLVKQVEWENGIPICDLDDELHQWTDIVAISVCNGNQIAGWNTWENSPAIAGLRKDGTVMLHGFDEKIEQKVTEWRDIVSIHAAGYGICGQKADGTIVAAYLNQNIADAVSKWTEIVDVDSSSVQGGVYVIGVKVDGTISAWGDRGGLDGATSWTDIVSVDVGDITGQCFKRPIIGLKTDGTVVVAGWRGEEQCDLSAFTDIRLP